MAQTKITEIRELMDQCVFLYTRQVEMKGLGDAILTGEHMIGQEPFGVILADDLCVGESIGVMPQMAEIHRKYGCSVIAIQRSNGLQVKVGPDTLLTTGAELLVIGSVESEGRFLDRYVDR